MQLEHKKKTYTHEYSDYRICINSVRNLRVKEHENGLIFIISQWKEQSRSLLGTQRQDLSCWNIAITERMMISNEYMTHDKSIRAHG